MRGVSARAAGRRALAGLRVGRGREGILLRLGLAGAAALLVANCAGPPQVASPRRSGVDPKYGVAPSPRVVGENDPVPKGGGRQLIGRPYSIAGRTYVPRENPRGYVRDGLASWYGTAFHGRLTANSEIFDRHAIAAAHPTLPLPSYVRVTNHANGRSMIVRVNDRGPYHADRLIDVSQRVADALGFERVGTTRVRVEYVGKASLGGSDDTKLMATLRLDGRPAPFRGGSATMVADAGAAPPPAQTRAVKPALRPALVTEPERPLVAQAAPAPLRRGDRMDRRHGPEQESEPAAPVANVTRIARSPVPPGPALGARADTAPVRVAAAPLPPARPIDLETIPNAGAPVAPSRPRSGSGQARGTLAGLY